jgi:transposase
MNKRARYSPEVREWGVCLLFDHRSGYGSERAVLVFIVSKIGCMPEMLRKWARWAEVNQGYCAGMMTSDHEQLLEFKRENRELKRANEILRKGSAFFAQAELDRRPKY